MYINRIIELIKLKKILLTHETMLGSTESKITKDKNGESVPHLEIVELDWFIATLLKMIISKIQNFVYFCTKQDI